MRVPEAVRIIAWKALRPDCAFSATAVHDGKGQTGDKLWSPPSHVSWRGLSGPRCLHHVGSSRNDVRRRAGLGKGWPDQPTRATIVSSRKRINSGVTR